VATPRNDLPSWLGRNYPSAADPGARQYPGYGEPKVRVEDYGGGGGIVEGATVRKSEPYRGPPKRRKTRRRDARYLLNPQEAWNDKAKKARARSARPATRTGEYPGIRSGSYGRGASFGAESNYYAMVLGETIYQHGRAVERREQLRRNILATGRRGAAATRPLLPSSPGTTNRSGAAATRRPAPAPAPDPATQGLPGGRPSDVAKPASAPAPAPRTAPATRTSPATLPRTAPATWPNATSWVNTWMNPRLSFTGDIFPLETFPRLRPGQAFDPVPGARPGQGLTPLEGVSVGSQPSPVPQEALDKCNCPPKKRAEKDKKKCTNPIISRSRNGDIETTKKRIICPSSKLKSLSQRTRPTATSWPGLPSSTLEAVRSFPWA